MRAKKSKKPATKGRPARLVFSFDSRALRDEFRGWMSDGGGEQAFMADLEYFADKGLGCPDFDYDGDVVRVTTKIRG